MALKSLFIEKTEKSNPGNTGWKTKGDQKNERLQI